MLTLEDEKKIFKAINNVSKKVNEVQSQLDKFIVMLHEQNTNAINDTEDALIELAELIEEKNGGTETND